MNDPIAAELNAMLDSWNAPRPYGSGVAVVQRPGATWALVPVPALEASRAQQLRRVMQQHGKPAYVVRVHPLWLRAAVSLAEHAMPPHYHDVDPEQVVMAFTAMFRTMSGGPGAHLARWVPLLSFGEVTVTVTAAAELWCQLTVASEGEIREMMLRAEPVPFVWIS
jgi:hypothetical protein